MVITILDNLIFMDNSDDDSGIHSPDPNPIAISFPSGE